MAPPILSADRKNSISHLVANELIDPINGFLSELWFEVLSAETRAGQMALLDIAIVLKNAADEVERMTKELTEGGAS